jgi:hypothetical protein
MDHRDWAHSIELESTTALFEFAKLDSIYLKILENIKQSQIYTPKFFKQMQISEVKTDFFPRYFKIQSTNVITIQVYPDNQNTRLYMHITHILDNLDRANT